MKFLVRCPSCERDYRSQCDDDTGLASDACPTCDNTAEDYWCPDD